MFFIGGRVDLLEEIDVIGIVQLVPVGDGGHRAAAIFGEGGDDLLPEVGVEDFADADHQGILKGRRSIGIHKVHKERIVHEEHEGHEEEINTS